MPSPLTFFDAPSDLADARAERQARVLERLCDLCMDVAEALREQVLGQVAAREAVDAGQTALALSRIARAVRLTLALEARLAEPPPERAAAAGAPGAVAKPDIRFFLRAKRRGHCALAAFKAIELVADGDNDRREELRSEVRERLREVDDDIMNRPIGEVVAILCREFGLPYDPTLWADEPWAIEEAENAESPWPPPAAAGRWAGPAPRPPRAGRADRPDRRQTRSRGSGVEGSLRRPRRLALPEHPAARHIARGQVLLAGLDIAARRHHLGDDGLGGGDGLVAAAIEAAQRVVQHADRRRRSPAGRRASPRCRPSGPRAR